MLGYITKMKHINLLKTEYHVFNTSCCSTHHRNTSKKQNMLLRKSIRRDEHILVSAGLAAMAKDVSFSGISLSCFSGNDPVLMSVKASTNISSSSTFLFAALSTLYILCAPLSAWLKCTEYSEISIFQRS